MHPGRKAPLANRKLDRQVERKSIDGPDMSGLKKELFDDNKTLLMQICNHVTPFPYG